MKNPLKPGELIKSPKNSPALLNTHLCQTHIHAFDVNIYSEVNSCDHWVALAMH